jgi:NDP-sugar pyrophosphorylase family protein
MTTVAIVLAGGVGSRFKIGTHEPKPLIRVLGRTQLFWSTKGAHLSYNPDYFIFACRTQLVDKIESEVKAYAFLSEFEVLDVGFSTEGPAHTVEMALKRTRYKLEGAKIIVIDNDCFNLINHKVEFLTFPFVTSTISSNPAHCFLDIADNSAVLAFHEKSPYGNTVISGNYGFSSPGQFMGAIERVRTTDQKSSELFLSAVMQILAKSEVVVAIQTAKYFSMGTPSEIDQVDHELQSYK